MKLNVPGAGLRLDPRLGNLRGLLIAAGERWLSPLHNAPWLDDPDVQADDSLPMVEKKLSGDFFCAPFGRSEDTPIHGWTANSSWEVEEVVQSGRAAVARLSLSRPVNGARIEKELRLRGGEPLLYQSHRISGGWGPLPVAHHPMVKMSPDDRLCFSPKQLAVTPDAPLEVGRNRLSYPAQSSDLSKFPGAGGDVDLRRYPACPGNEDFVTLIEARDSTLGWTAVLRKASNDIVFMLKDPAVLPVTMLWISNGGRDYAPWNGRHIGVLGIEDGCVPVAGSKSAQSLDLANGRVHVVRHVIGAVARPVGWTEVCNITLDGKVLRLHGDTSEIIELPFDNQFFAGSTVSTHKNGPVIGSGTPRPFLA